MVFNETAARLDLHRRIWGGGIIIAVSNLWTLRYRSRWWNSYARALLNETIRWLYSYERWRDNALSLPLLQLIMSAACPLQRRDGRCWRKSNKIDGRRVKCIRNAFFFNFQHYTCIIVTRFLSRLHANISCLLQYCILRCQLYEVLWKINSFPYRIWAFIETDIKI